MADCHHRNLTALTENDIRCEDCGKVLKRGAVDLLGHLMLLPAFREALSMAPQKEGDDE